MDEEKRGQINALLDKNPFEKKEVAVTPSQDPSKPEQLVHDMHEAAMVEQVKNDETIQKKILDQATKTIDHEIKKIESRGESEVQQAVYDANKEACFNYGVSESVPQWQVRLMRIGSGFWFVVYFIFASLTIAPVNIFFRGIKSFIKNNVVVFIFAIVCYVLIVVGIPLLITYFG